ncbi:4Fe-4S binding protein [Desulfitobacterium sp. Sab5]|uniref:4Fe-4S binding protein n=1 Tax=Desulfitobacterium nosdiversum TaxID=3375356 RepID=UPI003CEF5A79
MNNSEVSAVHNLCLRMQINWLFDPSQWSRFVTNPVYIGFFVILGVAFFFGPLFCGWLCAAGAITEYLSKLVPDRFKIDFSGKVNPMPIRYGFLAGYILTPFLGGSIGCAFCNYGIFQRFISGLTGDWQQIAYWSTTMIITTGLWFFLFGLFMKGGRGWCNFGCPVGAVQSLFYVIGAKFGFTYKLKYDSSKCSGCSSCIKACSTWSITKEDQEKRVSISPHTCNACLDCVSACPRGALSYGKGAAETNKRFELDNVVTADTGK